MHGLWCRTADPLTHLACPFQIRCIASSPWIVRRAACTSRNPCVAFTRRVISTINVEVVLGELVRLLPPTAWKQLADAQVDGWRRWDPEASPRPHRLWSRGDEVANMVELAPGFGQKWRSIHQKI